MDDPPDVSCQDSTRQHAVDGWQLSYNPLLVAIGPDLITLRLTFLAGGPGSADQRAAGVAAGVPWVVFGEEAVRLAGIERDGVLGSALVAPVPGGSARLAQDQTVAQPVAPRSL